MVGRWSPNGFEMQWRRDTCSLLVKAPASSLTHFPTPMDTMPTASPLLYSHSVKLTPADLTESFGVLASPFVLRLISIWQREVTYPCPHMGAVGRLQAEPSAPTLLPPRAPLSETRGSPRHPVFSWTVALCSSVGLLGPRHFVWPWKKVRCNLQGGASWKSAP